MAKTVLKKISGYYGRKDPHEDLEVDVAAECRWVWEMWVYSTHPESCAFTRQLQHAVLSATGLQGCPQLSGSQLGMWGGAEVTDSAAHIVRPHDSLHNDIIEWLHRLWLHNQGQYGNAISGAYFHFWLGKKKRKKTKKKEFNQSGKQLMGEKSSAETLAAALKLYCTGLECRLTSLLSCQLYRGWGIQTKSCLQKWQPLIYRRTVAIRNPNRAGKYCIYLQKHCRAADR